FPGRLRAVDEVEGVERVRFVTSHPKDLSSELMEAMAELTKACEHIHLPIQSGSDRILRAMRRGYTVEEYMRKVEALRSLIPEVGLTADIIVGFPGEGEEDHRATRELLSRVRYDNIFLFKYSPRPGTAAARLPNRVPPEVAGRRFSELLEVQKAITLEKNRSLEGRIEEVLVEGESKTRPDRLTGRTRSNRIVNFSGPEGLVGELVNCRITRGGLHSLEGELQN
ncbi:MAG: radical SAM protein, partial [Nitrospinota bacterium]